MKDEDVSGFQQRARVTRNKGKNIVSIVSMGEDCLFQN